MSDDERKALYNGGQGREYPQTCPKCGAEYVEEMDFFRCASWIKKDGSLYQTPRCRVAELTAENERLRSDSEQLQWIREKLSQCWPSYKEGQSLYGSFHVLVSHATGYEMYIASHKCDDKQGEIARQYVEIERLKRELEALASPSGGR